MAHDLSSLSEFIIPDRWHGRYHFSIWLNDGSFMPLKKGTEGIIPEGIQLKNHESALEYLFAAFNRGSGHEWNEGEFAHRSLSVGDIVSLNGVSFLCDRFGWERL